MRDARLATVEWRDLVDLQPFEIARELALPLLALAMAIGCGRAGSTSLLVLASGVLFMTGLRVTHGAFHRALGLRGIANDSVMLGLSALLGGSMHAIEVTHLRHHRDCLADEDVEGRIAALGFWRALLASPRYPFLIHCAAWRHGSARARRWIVLELVVAACVQVAVWRSGDVVLMHIALSLYLANALAAMPGIWFVHRGCHHGDVAIARSTRSHWLAWLTIDMFRHAEHHAFPRVPTCRLGELARRIDVAGATPPPIVGLSTADVDDPVDKLWIEARKRPCHAAVKRGCVRLAQSRTVGIDPACVLATLMTRSSRRGAMTRYRFIACIAAGALSAASAQKIAVPDAPPGPGKSKVLVPAAPVRKGMTWGVGRRLSADDALVFVSCHGRPSIEGHGCDAYVGDTACSRKRPLLCLAVDGRVRPEGIATPASGGVMGDGFYSGWSGGRVALTPAVRGNAFARRSDADAFCAATFGPGWRVAEHHDGVTADGSHGGWGFTALGHIAQTSRFWVAIDDTAANCWTP